MSLPNYLAKIKSSGVYRYVFDKSEIPATERNSLRLVVGYSEKGPFNTPVYINDASEFITTFGNVSRRMERKGVFFHRMAIQALEAGPILALNLKPFKNETSKMITFNASDIKFGVHKLTVTADYALLTGYNDQNVETGTTEYFKNPGKPDWKYTAGTGWEQDESAGTHIRTMVDGEATYWKGTVGGDGTFTCEYYLYNGEYLKVESGQITVSGYQTDHTADILTDALIALDGTNSAGKHWTTIYDTNRFWKVTDNLMNILPTNGSKEGDYMRIVQTGSKEDSVTLFIRPYVPASYNVKIADWYSMETAEEMPSYMEAIKDHYLSEYFVEIYVFGGDLNKDALFASTGTLGSWSRGETPKWLPFCKKDGTTLYSNDEYTDPFGNPADALEAMADVTTSNFVGKYQGIMFPNFRDTTGSFISIDSVFNSDYASHKCMMALNEEILDDAYEADTDGTTIAGLLHQLCSATHLLKDSQPGTTYDDYEIADVPVNNATVGYYLEGYNYTTILKNDSGRTLVEDKIYNVLNYKGMYEALTNNVDVDYKYWVDTFQGYPGVSMKANMSTIVKQKFNALAILNFPPMVDCAVYMGYPGINGGFNMNEVVKNGSGITLPAEIQGASWAAFYTQLQMTDGTNKFVIPSAALVSNLFMEKRNSRQPYYVVAGPNYGRITYNGVVGPDYNYARNDLDALEPFGVNAITYIPRKGVIINADQTAKQTPVSALSKIHIRELVTYLQDTIEDMLRNYQWELNTSTLRDAIRAKAETILGLIQANGGIYKYNVVCSDENNTSEIIDNGLVVLDVEIEPARASEKLVQTLTLHRTGGMA